MKVYLALALLFLASTLAGQLKDSRYPASELEVHIWPQPRSITTGDSTIYVDRKSFKYNIITPHQDLTDAVERYHSLIFPHTVPKTKNGITLPGVDITVDDLTAELQIDVDESYELNIPADGKAATLHAKTVYGAYHGLETLSQIIIYDYPLESYLIKKAPYSIQDAPSYSHRGILMDTSRHFLSTKSIRKIIDSLTYSKFNVLHWHISDDQSQPIQSKLYPNFWNGAYTEYEKYTQADVAEIVEYARKRGVRVMPEFDVPGHSTSWCVGIPEICPSPECPNPLDLTKNETYKFLDVMFSEMTGRKHGAGLFPDNFFHLGGDEVDTACWSKVERIAQWLKEHGMTNMDGYHHIVNEAGKIVLNQDRNPVNWEEVWNKFGTKLDKRTVIHIWLNKDNLKPVVEAGYRGILSNYRMWYLDYLNTKWETFYNNKLDENIDEQYKKNILGGEVCMWAETVDVSDWFNTVWPRAAAAGERLWSKDADLNDIKSAELRLMWFRCLLNRRGINAAPVTVDGRHNPNNQNSCFIQ